MSWATEAEVLALTGVEVTDDQIVQAQGLIDLYAGVVEGVADLTVRDTRLLRMATAYQAVWMASQIDVLSRTAVRSLDQDGVRVVPADPADLFYAPLARQALAQLSWNRRNGTREVRPGGPWTYRTVEEYAAAWMRDQTADRWRPM